MITEHRWIERQANEYNNEQTDAGQTQSWMRHPAKEPAERCAFQRPTHCNPLAIKLDRENQCDEKQRSAAEERELRVACRTPDRGAFKQYEQSKERWQRKSHRHQTGNSAGVRGADQLEDKI